MAAIITLLILMVGLLSWSYIKRSNEKGFKEWVDKTDNKVLPKWLAEIRQELKDKDQVFRYERIKFVHECYLILIERVKYEEDRDYAKKLRMKAIDYFGREYNSSLIDISDMSNLEHENLNANYALNQDLENWFVSQVGEDAESKLKNIVKKEHETLNEIVRNNRNLSLNSASSIAK